jgi:hypothetical protein
MNITGIELPRKHPDFFGIKWVLKARDKSNYRLLYKNILFDSDYWISTDGHRLHIYENKDSFAKGLYEPLVNNAGKLVLKLTSENPDTYPDWTKISCAHMKPVEIKLTSGNPSIDYSYLIRCLEVSQTLNFQYFTELHSIYFNNFWDVQIYDIGDPVYFLEEDRLAMIMPLHC